MKTKLTSIALTVLLATFVGSSSFAQTYSATPVTVSKEKVKSNGKTYYSHIVLERQTLYSISKAYNVSVEDIYEANPKYDLEHEGLKKDQIILIPVKDEDVTTAPVATSAPSAGNSSDYFIHTAKWFEDLDSIAEKYGTTADVLMSFNGLKSKTVGKKQKIKIPRNLSAASVPTETEQKQVEPEEPTEISVAPVETTVNSADDPLLRKLSKNGKKDINAVLMLPFNAQGRVSEDDMDFYAGALLAIKNLSGKGIGTDLSVYDVASSIPVTKERLEQTDVIVGPASSSDINKVLTILPENKFIISPLDLRGENIAKENGGVIQKPTSLESQYKDVVNWIAEDMKSSDKIIIISEKGAKSSASTTSIMAHLAESGLKYQNLTYGILEGRNVDTSLQNMMSIDATNRVIIVSESEAFVNDAVRNLSLLVFKKYNVALYAPAKIRSFETIDVEDFHKINLHVSMSYYIDYANTEVKDFLLEYRALYNTEPTPFAFQGYDTAKYFLNLCSQYGDNWEEMLPFEPAQGIQANFKFAQTDNDGYINEGIRRIVYGEDFSIKLVK